MTSIMERGKIKSIDRPKGFGFIETDEGDKVCFHQRWLKKIKFKDLKEGDEVVFEVNEGPRGPRAFNVGIASENEELVKVRTRVSIFKD